MLESNPLKIQNIFDHFLKWYPIMCLLLLVCLRRRSHGLLCSSFLIRHQHLMHTCVYLHCIVLQKMQRMQAALWGQFIWRQADMRNVLDYKCDQEHAKMQFIDHQYQFISTHLDGLLSNQLQIISNLENHLYTEIWCQMDLSPHQKPESGNPWETHQRHLIQIRTQSPSFPHLEKGWILSRA